MFWLGGHVLNECCFYSYWTATDILDFPLQAKGARIVFWLLDNKYYSQMLLKVQFFLS